MQTVQPPDRLSKVFSTPCRCGGCAPRESLGRGTQRLFTIRCDDISSSSTAGTATPSSRPPLPSYGPVLGKEAACSRPDVQLEGILRFIGPQPLGFQIHQRNISGTGGLCETMCWELGKRDMSGVITIGQSVVTGGRKGHR